MIEPRWTQNYENDTYTASQECACGNTTTATVQGPDLFKFRQGAHVQSAFPYLTDAEREALFITGICGVCWDAMFPDEDEEEDYYEDEGYYLSGSGEMSNDDSYIDYLNRN